MQPPHTIELSELEYQVNHLLRSLERLKTENNMLRQKLANNVRERSLLVEKNLHAAQKIKKIIAQLREEMP
ncbi:TIGR02449 family protein [Coxiella-like endosymbiont of Rhipicephalus sanguineus]|uniref:TIGR02449 family protein n=1 Tax=Coxiella-like endosymbiont of Rhipicephalus sanguineus TaxID=1955402 RepID=UPI00203FA7A3|nr:TIGR02449 family protein [Coxiella-like endosymbiont of Rhipicephalus sanguineus]MBT8506526.1 TIGR02449 family protein [Coxiella-like endosymbiont of Rhipicephalus sanguineus]